MQALSKSALKRIRSLKTAKGRQRHGLFIAEGLRLVAAALDAEAPVVQVLVREDSRSKEGIERLVDSIVEAGTPPVAIVSERDWPQVATTVHSQGIVAVVRMPGWPEKAAWRSGLMLALSGVRDPGNLGTIWRAAAWFGADRLVLGGDCVEPHNPKVVRGTMGGIFHVPCEPVEDLTNWLAAARAAGFRILAADVRGDLEDWPANVAEAVLVLGGETEGLGSAVYRVVQDTIRIPRWGAGDSLNVAMAACILLDRWRRATGEATRSNEGGPA